MISSTAALLRNASRWGLATLLATALAGCASLPASSSSAESDGFVGEEQLERLNVPAPEGAAVEAMEALLVAELAANRGNIDVAMDAYMTLLPKTRSVGAAKRATQIAVYAKHPDNAMTAAARWVELDPEEFEARKALVELLIENNRVPDTAPHLPVLARLAESGRGEGFAIVSTLLARAEQVEAALDVFGSVLDAYPDDVYANYHFARFALDRGAPERALPASEKLLILRPEWRDALKLNAQANILAGRPEQALQSFRKLMDEEPANWRLAMDYVYLLVQADLFEEAAAENARLSQRFDEDPEATYQIARVAIELGQFELAKSELMLLLNRGERENEAHFWLGRLAEDQQGWLEAIDYYDRVTDGQFFIEARSRIGALLARLGRLDEAAEHMAELREQRPDMALQLFLFEGEYLRQEGAYQDAIDALAEGLDVFPGNAELLYARALIAERIDRFDILEADLRQIIDNDPESAHALNALGYTLADRGERLEEARQLIERAYALAPEDYAIIDSMGWLFYRLGDAEKALQYLQSAYEQSTDVEIAAHLVEVLWMTGDRGKAREIFERALQTYPDDEGLRALQARLSL